MKSQNFTTFAYTESVRDAQERNGSRRSGENMENSGDRFLMTPRETEFIATRDSFYMATVGENGWPYVQHRGGPPGFLKIVDGQSLAFPDFRGNRQYISTGNVEASHKAALILMDYPHQQRLKVWVEARIVDRLDDPELVDRFNPADYRAVVERVFLLKVMAYDWNCPQHITPRFTRAEITAGMVAL